MQLSAFSYQLEPLRTARDHILAES